MAIVALLVSLAPAANGLDRNAPTIPTALAITRATAASVALRGRHHRGDFLQSAQTAIGRLVAIAGRRLVFDDEFDGTALNTSEWTPYYSVGNGGNGLRRPQAFSLDGNGNLVVTARMVNGQIVSGGMSLNHNYTYGYYEFRVKTEPDPTATMSGVVLTWPQSGNWPVDGENDIYETQTGANTREPFSSFVHYDVSNKQYYFTHAADAAEWQTMAMDWTASAIKIYRDGVLVWTVTDPAAIPAVAHHLCIQLDAMANRTLTRPVRMYVDYVRIYH